MRGETGGRKGGRKGGRGGLKGVVLWRLDKAEGARLNGVGKSRLDGRREERRGGMLAWLT